MPCVTLIDSDGGEYASQEVTSLRRPVEFPTVPVDRYIRFTHFSCDGGERHPIDVAMIIGGGGTPILTFTNVP